MSGCIFALCHRRRDLFPDCGCPPLHETAGRMSADGKKPRRFRRR